MAAISIVDYGAVNVGSVNNMLRKLGYETSVVSTPSEVNRATKLMLPGVGAFDQGISALADLGLVEPIRRKALQEKVPILGICLGMQMLGESSEEGSREGLGIIRGRCIKLRPPPESSLKVPHMGWNVTMFLRESPLVFDLDASSRFYYLHSYHLVCDDPKDVLATVNYGVNCTAMIQRGNVMGTQFHPEKSHRFGMAILRNFGEM